MSDLAENVLVRIARVAAYAGSRLLPEYDWLRESVQKELER